AFPPQFSPPTFDADYGKFGGVVADADGHCSFVAMNVVNAVGHSFAFFLIRKIMCVDRARSSLGFVGSACILFVSQRFLLLGVHRNGRFTAALLTQHPRRDMPKLSVSIRMLF